VFNGCMRGEVDSQTALLTLTSPEKRVPQEHPIRRIKRLADHALKQLDAVFDEMYSANGRPSIPPERLLKAQLLIALYSVRSERQFCERLDYDLLFRFFLDMGLDDPSWDATVFTKNRDRLVEHEVARLFFEEVVRQARQADLLSREHFTVDGTLIEAWASLKSFKRKGEKPGDRQPPDDPGNPTVDFHGEKRSNQTHESTTDPESRLARKGKGKEAKLCYSGHVLMENRHGLCVDLRIAEASGHAERDEAMEMLRRLRRRGYDPRTLAADKGYDAGSFPHEVLALGIEPHIAVNEHASQDSPARRFVGRAGYAVSQRIRKRIEEIFGWAKTIGGLRKTRYKGRQRTWTAGYLVAAAYNLLRITRLTMEAST
jgi:transposase